MMTTKSLLPVLLLPSIVLLIPAAAMLFKVDGWAWGANSFIIAWVLMAGVGLAYKLVTRKSGSPSYRIATGIALATGLILIWMNGAVGLIGNEDNPANLMYGGVLAVGVIGAVIARLESSGMAWALFGTAFAQLLVPVVALVIWRPEFNMGTIHVFILNFCFVLLFMTAALFFRQAARRSVREGASELPA